MPLGSLASGGKGAVSIGHGARFLQGAGVTR
jgi:hypothetical protein